MTRGALGAALAALLVTATASAQHGGGDTAAVPDVPSGPGRLVGEITNPDAPGRVGEVEILLYALPQGGTPGLRHGRSDTAGRFVFEGLSNDPTTSYLVGARYAGVPYPGERLSFAPGETERHVVVRVGEPVASAGGIAVIEVQLEIAWLGGRLGVSELVRFENRGDRTAFVPADRRASVSPLFRLQLPAGADDFQIPLGIQPEGLVREGAELRFYGPLYPSAWPGPLARDQGLAFQYTLPAPGGALSIDLAFPSGAERFVLIAPANGPTVEVAGAREEQVPVAEAQPAEATPAARRFVVENVRAGGRVAIRIDVPETRVDPDAVRLEETRIFLELDDAALQVQEEHVLRVTSDVPVVAPPDGELLAIPVPPGAQQVRFDREAFALGLAPDDGSGALLRGPLPPGETRFQVAYELPVTDAGAPVVFETRFGRVLPLLNIFVADTGLRTESDRLHRRRPVRTPDRTYLALEAYQIEPGETVQLTLAPLGPPAQLPRAALVVLVALAAGLAVAFVAAPLRPHADAAALPDLHEDAARREREAVYAALRDLEHDHETGKLSDEDHASMRGELRTRAAALLRAERARVPVSPRAAVAANTCPACSAELRPDDRFCARCGARVADPVEARA